MTTSYIIDNQYVRGVRYFLYLLPALLLFACQQKGESQEQLSRTGGAEKSETEEPASVQHLSTDELTSILADTAREVVLLDVRTPEEVAQGQIPGSMTINLYDDAFDEKIAELDHEKTYIVYCRSGNRSVTAGEKMIRDGFQDVFSLDGGFRDWIRKQDGDTKE